MASPRCLRRGSLDLPIAVSLPGAAVALFEHLMGAGEGPRSAALLIDPESGRPRTAMHRDGVVSGAELVQLCAICAGTDVGGGRPGHDSQSVALELLVMATWRAGQGAEPTDDDRTCWHTMLATTSGRAVHLVDWLLVDGDDVVSVATTVGRPRQW